MPLVVLSLTGWIPNKDLELGPEGPWSWGVYIGFFYFIVGLVLLLRPSQSRDPLRCCELSNESWREPGISRHASQMYPERSARQS